MEGQETGPERPNNRSGNCWLRYALRITQYFSNKTERCHTFTVDGRSFLGYPSKWRVIKLLKHRKRDRTNNRATNLVTYQILGPLIFSTVRWGGSDPTCIHYDCLQGTLIRASSDNMIFLKNSLALNSMSSKNPWKVFARYPIIWRNCLHRL